MPLDCTKSTAMFGSGAAIGGTGTIMVHQLTEVHGKLAQVIAECSVAVPGSTMRSIAAVPSSLGFCWWWRLKHRFSRCGSVGFSIVLVSHDRTVFYL